MTVRVFGIGLIAALLTPTAFAQVSEGTQEIGSAAANALETAATNLVLDSTPGESEVGGEKIGSGLLGDVSEALLNSELPQDGRFYLTLKGKDQISPTEQSIAMTVGVAEISGAILLRNNQAAGAAIAKEVAAVQSALVLPNGQPVPKVPIAPVKTPGPMGKWGSKILQRLGPVGRLAGVVGNLSALRGVRAGRIPMRTRLGGLGRFSTRQILYGHGAYNVLVGSTGRQVDIGFEFVEGQVPAAPEGGPLEAAEDVAAGVCPEGTECVRE